MMEQMEQEQQRRFRVFRVDQDQQLGQEQEEEDVMETGGNPNFLPYKEIFKNLTKNDIVNTDYELISMLITYDSTRAISVQKLDDTEYWIMQYDLSTQ